VSHRIIYRSAFYKFLTLHQTSEHCASLLSPDLELHIDFLSLVSAYMTVSMMHSQRVQSAWLLAMHHVIERHVNRSVNEEPAAEVFADCEDLIAIFSRKHRLNHASLHFKSTWCPFCS